MKEILKTMLEKLQTSKQIRILFIMSLSLEVYEWSLLYLSDSMHTLIGQFCGPYSPVRPTKFEKLFSCTPD